MADVDKKKLLSKITVLERENKKLKKQLSKYKKYVSKSANIVLDSYEKCQESELFDKTVKVKLCSNCGKGSVQNIKILDFSFEICEICGCRRKIK